MKLSFIFYLLLVLSFPFKASAQFSSEIILSDQITQPEVFLIEDLDMDGDTDIVAAGYLELAWIENTGSGFNGYKHVIQVFPWSTTFKHIDCKDMDQDGDMDVIVAASDIKWYENDGSMHFDVVHTITSFFGSCFDLVDLDGDLDLDMTFGNYYDVKIFYMENTGLGTYGTAQVITTLADSPSSLCHFDVDNDGDQDILSASTNDNKIAWYSNNGGGTFGPQVVLGTQGSAPNYITHADIDGDLDEDVLVTAYDEVYWYTKTGPGIFGGQAIISASTDANHLCVADFDNDGDQDISISYDSPGTGKFTWHKNLGAGVFGPEIILANNYQAELGVAVMNVNSDVYPEIIFVTTDVSKIGYFLNTEFGYFSNEVTVTPTNDSPTSGISADLNNDGWNELVISSSDNSRISFYQNLGGSNYSGQNIITNSASFVKDLELSDLDNDGDLDIVYGGASPDKVGWCQNLGNFNFMSPVSIAISSGGVVNSVFAGDPDNDGDQDILFGANSKVIWCKNLGTGTFSAPITITTLVNGCSDVSMADIDGDGNLDFLSSSFNDTKIAWYKNLGGGNFGGQQIITSTATAVNKIKPADIDNDGDIDLLAALGNGNFIELLNLGTGVFGTAQIVYTMTSSPSPQNCLDLSDLDNDGDLDFIIGGVDKNTIWLENIGGGSFGTANIIGNGIFNHFINSSDFDSDGDNDILTADKDFSKVVWHKNYLINEYQIKGVSYYDQNNNGERDNSEPGMPDVQILTDPTNDFTFSYSNGQYIINYPDYTNQIFEVFPETLAYWEISSDSLLYHALINNTSTYVDSLDFGFYPDSIVNSVSPELVGGFPSCNQQINYWINIQNTGTTTPHGIIELQLDDDVTFISSVIAPDSISGQTIYWHYDSLFFFETAMLNLIVEMPDFISMGDTLVSSLIVTAEDNIGTTIDTSTATLEQELVCAYDPNDKIANPAGVDLMGYIANATTFIDYTIRFQNTGTDTATDITIQDQLSPNLDWTTLNPTASSHAMSVYVEENGNVLFTFENIMLPDSGSNELASHGFVKYRIYLTPGLPHGTVIENTASIFFDFNPPIITNTKTHTIEDCSYLLSGLSFNESTCSGGTFEAEITNPYLFNYLWIINGSDTLIGNNVEWIPSINNSVVHLYANGMVCETDSLTTFNVFDLPVVTLQELNSDSLCATLTSHALVGLPSGGIFYGPGVSGDHFTTMIAGTGTHVLNYQYSDSNGCVSNDSITVVVTPITAADLSLSDNDTLCSSHDSLMINTVPSGGILAGAGISGSQFHPEMAGFGSHIITYEYSDIYGCVSSSSITIEVLNCLSINENSNEFIFIYPNPAHTQLSIESEKSGTYELINGRGQHIQSGQITLGQNSISVSSIEEGTYILFMILDNQSIVTKRIVVVH